MKECDSCAKGLTDNDGEMCPDCGEGPFGYCCIEPGDHECDGGGGESGTEPTNYWDQGDE